MSGNHNASDHDLIVLGSGPGGYIAAIRAAQLGRKVTIVEREALGGVCLNWGCIPSKALLKTAELYHNIKRASEFGIIVDPPQIDYAKIIERSRGVAGKLSSGVTYLMKKNKINVVTGHGTLLPGKLLQVVDRKSNSENFLRFNDIIIATGGHARTIPNVEIDGEVIHTYRTILEYKKLPKKALVIGAGAIGIEFAYLHSTLGSDVTVVEMQQQILPLEDTEIAQNLQKLLVKQSGLKFMLGTTVTDVKRLDGEKDGAKVSVTLKSKGSDGVEREESWRGDSLLIAIGVVPNTSGIGLEEVGITLDRGFIKVDKFMTTTAPHHYAIGDVVKSPALAHMASHEGIVAAESACGKSHHGISYDNVPSCTYCQPQVASVGLTEAALKERGIKYRVGKLPFSAVGKAIAIGEAEGMYKVLIDEEYGEVLGVHILHSEATELISEAAIIRSHEGIAASVLDTIHPHPTLSEAMAESMALALGRPLNF
jgi:dihydrolipoamide dehydrogenase